MKHFMNPQVGRHMNLKSEAASEGESEAQEMREHASGEDEGDSGLPHIFIHSHSKGHTVHIHHKDGRHEKHEHAKGDTEGMAEHLHQHLGGGESVAPPVGGDEGTEF